MAAQKIINGPSRWDIMLSFFENRELTFTLEGGTVVKMKYIDAMWDMHACDPFDEDIAKGDVDYFNGGVAEGYLLRGPSESGDTEVFVEYRVRSRRGLCSLVSENQCDSAYMPQIWSEIMGLDNDYTYNDNPS